MPSSDGEVQVICANETKDMIEQGAVIVTALQYLRVIHRLEAMHEVAIPTRIAQEMDVSVASASNMCKRLAGQELVYRQPRKGVVMTALGRGIVEEANHRRQLLLEFMVDQHKLSHEHALPEAERISLVSSTWFCRLLRSAVIECDAGTPGLTT